MQREKLNNWRYYEGYAERHKMKYRKGRLKQKSNSDTGKWLKKHRYKTKGAENERLKKLLAGIKGRLVSVHLTSKYDFGKEIEMIEKELKND